MLKTGPKTGLKNGLKNGWWVVAASFSALVVGSTAINVFAFGVFVIPVTQGLGISRGTFSGAMVVHGLAGALCAPLLGWLVDSYGVRRVLLPGVALAALATALYGLMTASTPVILALFLFSGMVGIVQSPLPYAAVINKWFDRRRGLALGFATSGVGLGAILVPQLALLLMQQVGWRLAYLGLAGAVLLLGFLPTAVLIRDPPPDMRPDAEWPDDPPGCTAAEALASWRFWVLAGAFLLGVTAINGTLSHLVPLLHDRGMSQAEAVRDLSGAGLAAMASRRAAGFLLDYVWGPLVALLFYGLACAGLYMLAHDATGVQALIGAMLCGTGIGAEIDLMGFLMSRYFGLYAFGRIYGLSYIAFALGNGLGPGISGWAYEAAGRSYTPIFTVYMVLLVIAAAALMTLGGYRYRRQPHLRRPELGLKPVQ
jgi:MFS family permease